MKNILDGKDWLTEEPKTTISIHEVPI